MQGDHGGDTLDPGVLRRGMPSKHARPVALSNPVMAWAEGQAAKGEYRSFSELIRVALRKQRAEDEARFALQAEPLRASSPMGSDPGE